MEEKVKIIWGKSKHLSLKKKKKLEEVKKMFVIWKETLCLHPDDEIHIKYVGKKKFKMRVNYKLAEYKRYILEVSKSCLKDKRDFKREADVIHETVHIVIYPYTELAENFTEMVKGEKGEILKELLVKAEESVVSRLELALARMVGIQI